MSMSDLDDDERREAIIEADDPAEIGIMSDDDDFHYVQTDEEIRIYADDESDEQWLQSDTTTEVEK